ncbi:MAG: pseudouridine synthase [Candidatus Curtissbacteria bacterium]|nr:pseudouridine synthase [Candidatus Curtissbacteria bacterium]
MRINKFLAHAGVASRRKVDELIEAGKVTVNAKRATLGQQIDPQKDEIKVNGKQIKSEEEFEYIILNKLKKETVLEQVKTKSRIYPVGRLDKESTGLILLTNDGELTNRLTHPRYHVEKVYEVVYLGKVADTTIGRIEKGIELEEGRKKEARVKTLSSNDHKTVLEITLYEGRKRQIRRLAEKLHLHIIALKRITIGPINLEGLESGKFRKLSPEEISALKKSAGI